MSNKKDTNEVENEEILNNFTRRTTSSPINKNYRDLLNALEAKKINTIDSLRIIDKNIEEVQKLRFVPGEPVFHKTHGNGIVVCAQIPDMYNSLTFAPSPDLLEIGYNVIFVKKITKNSINGSSVHINTSVETHFCKDLELIPYTQASKILYEDPKS